MKKVLRILAALSVLGLCGCDFLRIIAGRPTKAELAERMEIIEARKKAAAVFTDSASVYEPTEEKSETVERISEEDAAKRLDAMKIRTSSVFRFGAPTIELENRYNLVIGVYRNKDTADAQCNLARKKGYNPYYIPFDGGVNAVCLCGSDFLADILDVVSKADSKVCPKDAWIYAVK